MGASAQASSLWQPRSDNLAKSTTWVHLVTLKESPTQPPECKGAILADDVSVSFLQHASSDINKFLDGIRQNHYVRFAYRRDVTNCPRICGDET
jgi:hypothetical protein